MSGDLYTVSRTPGARPMRSSTPGTRGRDICPAGRKRPHAPGTPVLLGWPTVQWCEARTHNTIWASRGRTGPKCVCPGAKWLREDRRVKDLARQEAQRRAAGSMKQGSPEHREWVKTATKAASDARRKKDKSEQEIRERLESRIVRGPRGAGNRPACETRDPELWFSGYDSEMSEAISVCWTCPIQARCLRDAIKENDRIAIRGGLLPRERMRPALVQQTLREIESGM